jgi:signal transduction histidine kinase
VVLNALITFFSDQLNEALVEWPWLLVADLLLVSGLAALSGGWQTPYYLYALSPLLGAAFFFQIRGALLAAALLSLSYMATIFALYSRDGDRPNWLVVVMALVGFFLIGAAFGFASSLVRRLRVARDDVAGAHRDLQVIHDLTISLQSAADVTEVEERVLEAVTQELGFARAVVALVDQEALTITAWMGRARDGALSGRLPHSAEVPLSKEGGTVSVCLLEGHRWLATSPPFTANETINAEIDLDVAHLFPLALREHPVGILMVDAAAGSEQSARLQSLEAIANQAAVTLGTTMMCIDRAQRLAVQEERVRIARDIHDTVSQSLFGIVYTLDGALKLLPERPELAGPELERVLSVAHETRSEIRKSILDIWPSELTAEQFAVDLRKYADNICQAEGLAIDFSVHGDFARLSPRARRSLYRISQEALANVAHHARASNAQVCLDVGDQRAMLSVRDDGQGFEPDLAMQREYNRERFGLWGMRERALSLGGHCEIQSQPGAGTTVIVDVPVS